MEIPDPIVLAIDLAVPAENAYEAFTRRFGDWWPVVTHSLSRNAATRCRLDSTPGGAVDECAPDGARHIWGEVDPLLCQGYVPGWRYVLAELFAGYLVKPD